MKRTGEVDLHVLHQTVGAVEGSRTDVILRKVGRGRCMETPRRCEGEELKAWWPG